MKGKVRQNKRNKAKRLLACALIVQTLVIFTIVFAMLLGRNLSEAGERVNATMRVVDELVPELEENEKIFADWYESCVMCRIRFLAEFFDAGWVETGEDLEKFCNLLMIDHIYITDANGNIKLSCGHTPQNALPYTGSGPDVAICELDENREAFLSGSPDGSWRFVGCVLKDGSIVSVEISGETENRVRDETLSLVGQLGLLSNCSNTRICTSSKDDMSVLSDSDSTMVGRNIYGIGAMGPETENLFTVVSADKEVLGFAEIVKDLSLGVMSEYGDICVTCMVPLADLMLKVLVATLQITAFISLLLWVMEWYAYYAVKKRDLTRREFRQSFVVLSATVLILVSVVSAGWEVFFSTADDFQTVSRTALEDAVTLTDYQDKRDLLCQWLDEVNLVQCRIAAELISQGMIDDDPEIYAILSEDLGVDAIYHYDRSGKVVMTDSGYDHFKLRTEKDSQSAAFLPLLEGVDYVIQEVMPDDISGKEMQYIGVSIRNAEGRSNGFVQIAVDPDYYEAFFLPLEPENTLRYMLVGGSERIFLVDKKDLQVSSSSDKSVVEWDTDDLGLSGSFLADQTAGYIRNEGIRYIAIARDLGDQYFVSQMKARAIPDQIFGIHWILLVSALILCLSYIVADKAFAAAVRSAQKDAESGQNGETSRESAGSEESEEEEQEEEEEEEEEEEPALGEKEQKELLNDDRGFFIFSKLDRSGKKRMFEERWQMKKKPADEETSGDAVLSVLRRCSTFLFLLILIPFVLYLFGIENSFNSALVFMFLGEWERGFHIFTAVQCCIMVLGMYIINLIMRHLLYEIGKISNTRVETICLMIRNSLKYVFLVIAAFYILRQFGVEPNTLLASAGILSVVLGFGAQHAMADILAGFFIIVEGSFRVGDFISMGDIYGTVSEIGIRTTRIVWFADTTIINNSEIKKVVNSSGDVMRMVVEVPIRYDEDLEKAEKIFEKELPLMKDKVFSLVDGPYYRGVTDYSDRGVVLRFVIFADSSLRMPARRSFLRELRLMFAKNNIEIAGRQLEVHSDWGERER